MRKFSLTTLLCDTKLWHMHSVNIRSLKHDTSAILEHVGMGESVEIRRRKRPIAVLRPVKTQCDQNKRPDFQKRIEAIYGDRVLPETATALLAEERGER